MRAVQTQTESFRALATPDSLAQAWCATIPTNAQLLHSHAVQQELPAQILSGRTAARAATVTQVCVRRTASVIILNKASTFQWSTLFVPLHCFWIYVYANVSSNASSRVHKVCAWNGVHHQGSKVHNYISTFFVIFSWSHDLENVTACSVWRGVRRTPGLRAPVGLSDGGAQPLLKCLALVIYGSWGYAGHLSIGFQWLPSKLI